MTEATASELWMLRRAPRHVYLRAAFFCVLGLAAARQRKRRSPWVGGIGHTGHTPKDNRGHMLHPCFRKLRSRKRWQGKKKKFLLAHTGKCTPHPPFPNSTSDAWELQETFLGCLVLGGTGPLLRWYFRRTKPFCPKCSFQSFPEAPLDQERAEKAPKPQRTAVGPLPAYVAPTDGGRRVCLEGQPSSQS